MKEKQWPQNCYVRRNSSLLKINNLHREKFTQTLLLFLIRHQRILFSYTNTSENWLHNF